MKKRRVRYVEQNEHSECGVACITMLLNYYGRSVDLMTLRERYGIPNGGNNFQNLIEILNDYGLKSSGIRVEINQLKQMQLPCIAFWEGKHFVVIEKVKKNSVIIVDPALGRKEYIYEHFVKKFFNVVLVINEVTDTQVVVTERKSFLKNFVVNHLKEYRMRYAVLFFVSLLIQITSLLFSVSIKQVIDTGTTIVTNTNLMGLVAILLIYFLLQVSRSVTLSFIKMKFNQSITQSFVKKICCLSLSFFVNRTSGDIIYRYNLITYVQQMLSQHLLKTSIDILFSVVYIALMLYYSPILTMITIGITLILIVVSLVKNKYILSVNNHNMILQSKSQSIFLELLSGIETIKAMGVESNFYDTWDKVYSEQQKISYKTNLVDSWLSSINQTIMFSTSFLIIFIGIFIKDSYGLSWGTIISFSTLATTFITPVAESVEVWGETQLVRSYVAKIDEILNQKDYRPIQDHQLSMSEFNKLELKNVSFRYSFFDKDILDNVVLAIKKNEKIAIVGPSGSGKSTLIKIISGLYNASMGRVEINKVTGDEFNLFSVHEKIVYVPQSPTVFNMTLLENLLLNTKEIDIDYLNQVLIDTSLADFINELPQREQTQISEEGMNLSGGQKQKIMIARALLKQPELLLFDEATSSLDNISEETIINSLKNYPISLVFISHRLSTIKKFDKIIVLNEGKIDSFGTHEELLAKSQLYTELYQYE